eukprot:gene8089-1332_t
MRVRGLPGLMPRPGQLSYPLPGHASGLKTVPPGLQFNCRPLSTNSHVCRGEGGEGGGIILVFEPPPRRLVFRHNLNSNTRRRRRALGKPTDVRPSVELDVIVGGPSAGGLSRKELTTLSRTLKLDAAAVMRQAMLNKAEAEPEYKLPRGAVLSLVLCDDPHIRGLNLQHRGKDAATDVLSFEMSDEMDYAVHLPMKLLGDMVISVDTASRQAEERGLELLDELRVLLVHGTLHLLGMDHEKNLLEAESMAAEEQRLMEALGWEGEGLISAVGGVEEEESQNFQIGNLFGSSSSAPSRRDSVRNAIKANIDAQTASLPATSSSDRPQDRSPIKGGLKGGKPSQAGTQAGKPPRSSAPPANSTPKSDSGKRPGPRGEPSDSSPRSSSRATGGSQNPGFGNSSSGPNRTPFPGAPKPSAKGGEGKRGQGPPRAVRTYCTSSNYSTDVFASSEVVRRFRSSDVRMVALDMDGTLLNSSSKMMPCSVKAIQQASRMGVRVFLATGKARPAALKAASIHGLEGDDLLVSPRTPGIFLQGLSVHGNSGAQLSDPQLSSTTPTRPRTPIHTGDDLLVSPRTPGIFLQGLSVHGDDLLVSPRTPGIFLQGLSVHGNNGAQLSDSQLPSQVVLEAFQYVRGLDPALEVSLVAFFGDECATLQMNPDVESLHSKYYEPLSLMTPDVESLHAKYYEPLSLMTPDVESLHSKYYEPLSLMTPDVESLHSKYYEPLSLMTPDVESLHSKYYEPLSLMTPDVESLHSKYYEPLSLMTPDVESLHSKYYEPLSLMTPDVESLHAKYYEPLSLMIPDVESLHAKYYEPLSMMTPDVESLHSKYYEPLSLMTPDVESLHSKYYEPLSLMPPDVESLHSKDYEPLSLVFGTVDELLAYKPVKKLLYMTKPATVDGVLRPHWEKNLQGQGASLLQAVPDMLEVVPEGVNKWVGAQVLLDSLGLKPSALMAVGDGGNDYEIVANAGIGVAMGNAVDKVRPERLIV